MKTQKLLIFTFVLISILFIVPLLPVHGEAEIYDSVVRLHVLANSDSEEDQARKLRVRDAVLSVTTPLVEGCETREDAEAVLRENLDAIQAAAEGVIAAEGRSDAITVYLDEEEYPRRDYDSICFPKGTYLSLRVCIGDAEGQNWWCCLFPPLCLGTSTVSGEEAEEEFISVGLTPDQYKIITETDRPVYKARFKILEVINSVFGK